MDYDSKKFTNKIMNFFIIRLQFCEYKWQKEI